MSRRRRGTACSLATGAKMHVRVTKQRPRMRSHQQQSLDARYLPSDALPSFSTACDSHNKSVTEPTTASLSREKEHKAHAAELRGDESESTVSEDSDNEEQEEKVSEAARGVVTTTTFASQPFARFEVAIEKRSERYFQIAVRSLKTNEKWESEPIQLRDFVTEENRIPSATLDDYIKCFKDALGDPRAAPVDLVPALLNTRNTVMRLEISLYVRVSSLQCLASFEFHLVRTKEEDLKSKLALMKLESRLQTQKNEIETLKEQVAKFVASEKNVNAPAQKKSKSKDKKAKKKYGVYFRATSVFAATRDKVIDWRTDRTSDAFHNAKDSVSSLVRFTRPGLFAVLVVMHHSNCEDESEAFQLLLNGDCVQSCFASNADGMRQTSSLVHFVHAKADDKLAVMYKGSGNTDESASFIEVNLMR